MEPPKKTSFPPEFCNEICTIYVRAIKSHNSEKKNKMLFRFKMAANFDFGQILKNHFPKGIFQ